MTVKKQPTILDKLFNVTVSNRDVKKWLTQRAEELRAEQLETTRSEVSARQELSRDLMAWMHEKSFTCSSMNA